MGAAGPGRSAGVLSERERYGPGVGTLPPDECDGLLTSRDGDADPVDARGHPPPPTTDKRGLTSGAAALSGATRRVGRRAIPDKRPLGIRR